MAALNIRAPEASERAVVREEMMKLLAGKMTRSDFRTKLELGELGSTLSPLRECTAHVCGLSDFGAHATSPLIEKQSVRSFFDRFFWSDAAVLAREEQQQPGSNGLTYVSFASGRLFTDFMLLMGLLESGAVSNLRIVLIDSEYSSLMSGLKGSAPEPVTRALLERFSYVSAFASWFLTMPSANIHLHLYKSARDYALNVTENPAHFKSDIIVDVDAEGSDTHIWRELIEPTLKDTGRYYILSKPLHEFLRAVRPATSMPITMLVGDKTREISIDSIRSIWNVSTHHGYGTPHCKLERRHTSLAPSTDRKEETGALFVAKDDGAKRRKL